MIMFVKFFVKKRKKIEPTPPVSTRILRKHKQVLLFNDKEMEVISQYCKKYKIEFKARFFREAIITTILKKMEEDHPKLF
jgi:hypothetical protein